ncbi:hypothetical protein GLOTRDRAFT_139102 [Gloeophyllum trabeum ATCC 11539]|uniref:Borealin N-terminal domain-containing protein n=1 Tax=Gloeophyllum trabeum (strain ATCC 11539 / FP-39264 / Madison 617) TaxID=670483 RepID=S7RP21_GLOTA|nr:uncharacterized protein GLOTRDRAFT_139102 [Gloeophyllum trabeum ATCC 11539]EPQ54529.1 hypothetical protein GLOTRDRAFT_139102 [Gloeophyllum trabeum ATCC 11539]
MELPDSTRKYTREEQAQLLANLEIELEHKTRQFEEWAEDGILQFRMRQEGLISRMPKQLRNMSISEFMDKYDGNVQAATLGVQREKMVADTEEIARSVRKRKWDTDVDDQGASKSGLDAELLRARKNARLGFTTPKKAGPSNGPGTAQRMKAQMGRTPGTARFKPSAPAPSPSPSKTTRFATGPTTIPFPHSRPASPSKSVAFGRSTRPPSSAVFNPSMPHKTPAYPPAPRWPRKGEHLLSINGSPLQNPLWGSMDPDDKMEGPSNPRNAINGHGHGHKRVNSITILKTSTSMSSSKGGPSHSRANSRADNLQTTWKPPSSSHDSTRTRTDSGESDPMPATPVPARAMVSVPIRDGRVLQFDPLEASPGMLDDLEGLTGSAKKQARDEMAKLVKAALDKWKLD